MHRTSTFGLLVIACGALAAAAVCATPRYRFVYLTGAALEQLRVSNPTHYARARKIMAAADEVCREQPASMYYAKFDARDLSCLRALVKTSLPPKREISFTLDDTHYTALVVLHEDVGRLLPIAAH